MPTRDIALHSTSKCSTKLCNCRGMDVVSAIGCFSRDLSKVVENTVAPTLPRMRATSSQKRRLVARFHGFGLTSMEDFSSQA